MRVLIFVICALCVDLVVCENTYKAAVVTSNGKLSSYSTIIKEAGHLNADILVLPLSKSLLDGSFADLDDYDEITKTISESTKRAGVYVVAHLLEKTAYQSKEELVRSNLVFDRQGAVIAAYQKPLNTFSNCSTSSDIPVFTTDFGVTLGLMMEEDLVLQRPDQLNLKNYVVAGGLKSELTFLSESQFASSWAFVKNANLLTSSGLYIGRAGFKSLKAGAGNVAVVRMNKDGGTATTECGANPSSYFPSEDLSQYIIRPLDIEAASKGHSETVCHGKFCCDFYVKTFGSIHPEVSYGLAAFTGVRHFVGGHHIGAQSCAIIACAGLYKRTCALGPNNTTDTHFEKITIAGNFTTGNTAQFPLVITTSESHSIKFNNENSKTAITIENGSNVLNFGIFGRDYGKDFESYQFLDRNEYDNYYDYFFNDDVQEFFDYVWIRLRILLVIVSIYVLEMM